jgi:hypothetical protein
MISYELALTLSVIGVLLLANTLSLREIVAKQGGAFWSWYFFPQFFGFLCFFISSLAETNRSPFDLAEAESELVAGFHTEYSSMKFAMFFMAEYAHMFTASFLATILFFGGWLSPFPDSGVWVYAHYLPCWPRRGWGSCCWLMRPFYGQAAAPAHPSCSGVGVAGRQRPVDDSRRPRPCSGPLLVHRQSYRLCFRLCLGARHLAALPVRPVDGLWLEIPPAAGGREHYRHQPVDCLAGQLI